MASDLSQVLKKGTLLIIETGEYSDKQWFGPFKMLKTASKQEMVNAFRSDFNPNKLGPQPPADDFAPWLIKSGYAEQVTNAHDWYVGSYYDFEP